MLDHSKSIMFGAVHSRGADVFFLILLWVEKNCFRNWFAHGDQTAAEDPSKKCGAQYAQTSKSGSRTSRFKVSSNSSILSHSFPIFSPHFIPAFSLLMDGADQINKQINR